MTEKPKQHWIMTLIGIAAVLFAVKTAILIVAQLVGG
jgi:hypothetical protein